MEWDTTWNCAAGKLSDPDADVLYDPWDGDIDPLFPALGIDNGPERPLGKPGP